MTSTATPAPTVVTTRVSTPIGPLSLAAVEDGTLVGIGLPQLAPLEGRPSADVLAPAVAEIGRYFAGELRSWAVRTAPAGTDFQLAVWAALGEIPYGETWTYGRVAAAIGRPGAARAVGAANRANPLPIVVPCHRVIGADGSLTGYAGTTGLGIKRQLLDHEAGIGPLAL